MSNLKVDIAARKAELAKSMSAEQVKLLERSTKRIVEARVVETAAGIGDKFPQFSLPNVVGNAVSSEELLERGPLVVNFFRGGWCPYSSIELRAYQALLPEIHGLGAEFIAISPQLPDESLSMVAKLNCTFEVLSDTGNSLAEHLGLVYELSESVADLYRSMGYDLERINGNMRWTLPITAMYVVSGDHDIKAALKHADYTVRSEPDEVINQLKML